MGESSKRNTGRPGRQVVVDAATRLARSADLTDVFRFLTDRAVADEAGVQPGTVHYHFGARRGSRSLPLLVLRGLLSEDPPEPVERTRQDVEAAIGSYPSSESAILADVRDAAARHLQETFDYSSSEMAILLAAAVAPNDRVVADELRERYDVWTEEFAASYSYIAETLNREFRNDIDIDAETLAIFITAMFDGLLMRHRFDDRVRADAIPELFGEMVIRLFVGATASENNPNDLDEVTGRLFDALPGVEAVDDDARESVIAAATDVYLSEGAVALHPSRVASRGQLRRSTVSAVASSRGELAVMVWARLHLDALVNGLEADRYNARLDLVDVVSRYLVNLVDCARRDIDLTRLMVDALLRHLTRHGPVRYDDVRDPRSVVPLPQSLAAVMAERADEVRGVITESEESTLRVASTLVNIAFIHCLVSPEKPATQLVDHILTTTFEGISAQ